MGDLGWVWVMVSMSVMCIRHNNKLKSNRYVQNWNFFVLLQAEYNENQQIKKCFSPLVLSFHWNSVYFFLHSLSVYRQLRWNKRKKFNLKSSKYGQWDMKAKIRFFPFFSMVLCWKFFPYPINLILQWSHAVTNQIFKWNWTLTLLLICFMPIKYCFI